jgi:hypothetical protein
MEKARAASAVFYPADAAATGAPVDSDPRLRSAQSPRARRLLEQLARGAVRFAQVRSSMIVSYEAVARI